MAERGSACVWGGAGRQRGARTSSACLSTPSPDHPLPPASPSTRQPPTPHSKGVTFASAPDAVAPAPPPAPRLTHTPSHGSEASRARAHEALAILLEGNARFVSGAPLVRARADPGALTDLASDDDGARPLAAVLACSDSRCPPELLFDGGVGDLAVVRVSGGALDPVVVDSVIAAVTHNGARLVLVLGHTRCGAVRRAVARYVAKEGTAEGGGGGGGSSTPGGGVAASPFSAAPSPPPPPPPPGSPALPPPAAAPPPPPPSRPPAPAAVQEGRSRAASR